MGDYNCEEITNLPVEIVDPINDVPGLLVDDSTIYHINGEDDNNDKGDDIPEQDDANDKGDDRTDSKGDKNEKKGKKRQLEDDNMRDRKRVPKSMVDKNIDDFSKAQKEVIASFEQIKFEGKTVEEYITTKLLKSRIVNFITDKISLSVDSLGNISLACTRPDGKMTIYKQSEMASVCSIVSGQILMKQYDIPQMNPRDKKRTFVSYFLPETAIVNVDFNEEGDYAFSKFISLSQKKKTKMCNDTIFDFKTTEDDVILILSNWTMKKALKEDKMMIYSSFAVEYIFFK